MAFPLLNVIISEVRGQCHFAASSEICEHDLWERGRKYMLSVQVWHTRVCTAGRKLPWGTKMGGREWAHLLMVLCFFPVTLASQVMQCGQRMSSHPSHPARVEWETGRAWEQLPSLQCRLRMRVTCSQLWYLPLTNVKAVFSSWMYIFVTWRFLAAVCWCPAECVSKQCYLLYCIPPEGRIP